MILWEQVAYLVPDQRRRLAYSTLRAEIGLEPPAILRASDTELEGITRIGGSIAARSRASRIRESAALVVGEWGGDLRAALRLPLPQARRALAQFPMIGAPGADRILVIGKRARLLPLDSNGLRVLVLVGLVSEAKSYGTTYRRAQETLASSLPNDHNWLFSAYALLRLDGQELCRRAAPICSRCPLRLQCPSSTAA